MTDTMQIADEVEAEAQSIASGLRRKQQETEAAAAELARLNLQIESARDKALPAAQQIVANAEIEAARIRAEAHAESAATMAAAEKVLTDARDEAVTIIRDAQRRADALGKAADKQRDIAQAMLRSAASPEVS